MISIILCVYILKFHKLNGAIFNPSFLCSEPWGIYSHFWVQFYFVALNCCRVQWGTLPLCYLLLSAVMNTQVAPYLLLHLEFFQNICPEMGLLGCKIRLNTLGLLFRRAACIKNLQICHKHFYFFMFRPTHRIIRLTKLFVNLIGIK